MAKENEFKAMTLEQLQKELLSMRLRRHARQLEQTHRFSQVRREIARRHTASTQQAIKEGKQS